MMMFHLTHELIRCLLTTNRMKYVQIGLTGFNIQIATHAQQQTINVKMSARGQIELQILF